jgi:hypothetical protein
VGTGGQDNSIERMRTKATRKMGSKPASRHVARDSEKRAKQKRLLNRTSSPCLKIRRLGSEEIGIHSPAGTIAMGLKPVIFTLGSDRKQK